MKMQAGRLVVNGQNLHSKEEMPSIKKRQIRRHKKNWALCKKERMREERERKKENKVLYMYVELFYFHRTNQNLKEKSSIVDWNTCDIAKQAKGAN